MCSSTSAHKFRESTKHPVAWLLLPAATSTIQCSLQHVINVHHRIFHGDMAHYIIGLKVCLFNKPLYPCSFFVMADDMDSELTEMGPQKTTEITEKGRTHSMP